VARWWHQDVGRVEKLPWGRTELLAAEMRRVEALRNRKGRRSK